MAVRLADALRRGALCAADVDGPDLLRVDWFAHVARPIDEVQAEFGVVPKSEYAIASGSVTAWGRGGISPYQYECGRSAAQAAGREDDSYGAQPASSSTTVFAFGPRTPPLSCIVRRARGG